MKSRFLGAFSAFVITLGIFMSADAALIHESATLGTPGLLTGVNISSDQWLSSRFSLSTATDISDIGGHLMSVGTIFAAIVTLPSPSGLPDLAATPSGSGGNTIADVALAYTVFEASAPSSDFLTPLSVTLEAGDYALIFGSSAFGTTGWGKMPMNNTNIEGASYFMGVGANYYGDPSPFDNTRFVVQGTPVPEPSSILLLGSGLVGLIGLKRKLT